MLGARPRLATRLNLTAIRQITTQASYVFVVYLTHVVNAKGTDLSARPKIAATATGPISTTISVPATITVAVETLIAPTRATLRTIRDARPYAISPLLHVCMLLSIRTGLPVSAARALRPARIARLSLHRSGREDGLERHVVWGNILATIRLTAAGRLTGPPRLKHLHVVGDDFPCGPLVAIFVGIAS